MFLVRFILRKQTEITSYKVGKQKVNTVQLVITYKKELILKSWSLRSFVFSSGPMVLFLWFVCNECNPATWARRIGNAVHESGTHGVKPRDVLIVAAFTSLHTMGLSLLDLNPKIKPQFGNSCLAQELIHSGKGLLLLSVCTCELFSS
jgi:hypothetical protein